MPLLVSSEHSCCLWLAQSKYFYSSVVLENDVYSSPGDGSQPRLNTVFLIVFFFLYSESFVWVLLFLCQCEWNATFTSLFFFFCFFGSHHWFAATVKLLGYYQPPPESLLHMCRGFTTKLCTYEIKHGCNNLKHLSASQRLSCSVTFDALQLSSRHEGRRFLHIISSLFRPKFYLLGVTGAHLIKCVTFQVWRRTGGLQWQQDRVICGPRGETQIRRD